MKKSILYFCAAAAVTLASCGEKKQVEEAPEAEVTHSYSVEMEAIFEVDDSLVAFASRGGYFDYDHPVSAKVTGSPVMQKVTFAFPGGDAIDNVKVTPSTNKAQGYITIKNMSVLDNGKIIADGDNGKHASLFATDQSFEWDAEKSRHKLIHTNQYPPCFIGTEELQGALEK